MFLHSGFKTACKQRRTTFSVGFLTLFFLFISRKNSWQKKAKSWISSQLLDRRTFPCRRPQHPWVRARSDRARDPLGSGSGSGGVVSPPWPSPRTTIPRLARTGTCPTRYVRGERFLRVMKEGPEAEDVRRRTRQPAKDGETRSERDFV
jgi:hypothetical protein